MASAKSIAIRLPLVILLVMAAAFAASRYRADSGAGAAVFIGNQTIAAQIARTPQEQYQGLSGRPEICPACGLLFVFNDRAERSFVMREMRFPLDIIFIDQGRIVKIAANLPPDPGPELVLYQSGQPADMVLEVRAGTSAAAGWQVGDEVRVQFNDKWVWKK